MAASTPDSWFRFFSINNSNKIEGRFCNFSFAVPLRHAISIRCATQLHLLLCPSSLEVYRLDLDGIQDLWCSKRDYFNKQFLLQALADKFQASLSFFTPFFGGRDYSNKNTSQFKNPGGQHNNERLWTNVFLALNVIVFIGQVASRGKVTLWGAKVNSLIDRGQLWRLITSAFLHANIGHLMINCYSLNSIGPTVEKISGPKRFIVLYLASAIASSLMSYRYSQAPAVGASGAIFGLVGSLGVFILRHRNMMGGGKQGLQEIGRVIAINMMIGFLSRGIDNWGHFGGLLGGAAMSWFLGPAWEYKFKIDGRRSAIIDRAPVFYFTDRKRLT